MTLSASMITRSRLLSTPGETSWRYGVKGIPHYILIGRDNRIAVADTLESRHLPPTEEQIKALLQTGS